MQGDAERGRHGGAPHEERARHRGAWIAAAVVAVGAGCAPAHEGPAPLWSSDAASADNPVPDARDVKEGKLALPHDFAFAYLPQAAWTAEAETTLTNWERFLGEMPGWGVYAPVLLRFSAPLDAAHIDERALAFVVAERSGAVVAAHAQWVNDPGYLAVRPASPLPPSTRVLLAVRRSVDGGDLARTADFDAFAHGAGEADVAAAAAALGVDADELALVAAYVTGDPAGDLARAADAVRDRVPPFSFAPPVAPADLPDALKGHIDRLPDGVRVAVGTFTDLDMRPGEDGVWDLDRPGREVSLDVLYALPDASRFPPPWPAVIAQHGFDDDRTFGLKVGDQLLARGMAVFSIDASSQGGRGSSFTLFRVDDPRVAREHLRQTSLDLVQLATLVTAGHVDVDGVPGDDLDGSVTFFGHSMGTIVGAPLLAVDHRFDAGVLNAPGSSFYDMLQSGVLKAGVGLLLKPAIGLSVDDPAYDDALPLCGSLLQTLIEPADPIAYAALRPATAPPLLLQMNDGDRTLPNGATRDLAAALGVDERAAPEADGAAVDALWVMRGEDFDYPPDDNPHGLHMFAGAPGIHAQMAAFLQSKGTVLLDPVGD